ncbi:MAG TPA: Trm112 family protein [Sphingomonadales bacterium]
MVDMQDNQDPGGQSQPESGAVDPRLLEILVCPLTKGPLEYDRARNELISRKAGLAYPIRDGIPIMLVDEARQLDETGAR